jgi:hypothetical protein
MPYPMKLCKVVLAALALLSMPAGLTQGQNADSPGWQRITSAENHFAVLMPAKPTVRDIADGPEGTTTRQFFATSGDGKVAYLVRVQHAQAGYAFSAVPDGVAERYARAVDITLDSQRDLTFVGAPAHEALLHDKTIRHRVIWLAAHNSIYVIGAAGSDAFQSGDDARRFFESFELIGTP